MKTFQVNNSDSSRVMFDKLNSYVDTIKKEKYNYLLKLLNALFEKENITLRKFAKIDCEYFKTKPISTIVEILETHKLNFNYDISKLTKDEASIEIFNKEMFAIITKLLKIIDYKLIKLQNGGNPCYCIVFA